MTVTTPWKWHIASHMNNCQELYQSLFSTHVIWHTVQHECWDENIATGHGIRLRKSWSCDRLDKFKVWVFKLSRAAPGHPSHYFSVFPVFSPPCARVLPPTNLLTLPMVLALMLYVGSNTLLGGDDLFDLEFPKITHLNLLNFLPCSVLAKKPTHVLSTGQC